MTTNTLVSRELLGLTGTLKATETVNGKATGKVFVDERNLIMLVSKQHLLEFLYLADRTSSPITTLHVGVGGCIDPEALYPKDVSNTETELYDEILSVATSYSVTNSIPSVTFIADIEDSDAVGDMISEAALFTSLDVMFNKKTFPGIPKTSEFGIHFEWTISLL
jgi:hypothetical protein